MVSRNAILGALFVSTFVTADAVAKSSLGIGSAEVTAPVSDGMFSAAFIQIAVWQREFFSALRYALVGLKRGDDALVYLVGLSFAYGVFHAAGPGHGKAVISAYMLASRAELKRGVFLAFVSSLVQAASAIGLVGGGWYALRGTGVSMTNATDWAELASYGLVVLVGLYMLGRALRKLGRDPMTRTTMRRIAASFARPFRRHQPERGSSLAFAGPTEADWREPASAPARQQAASRFAATAFEAGTVCADDPADCDCGRAHMPAPETLSKPLTLKSGIAAVFAVGLRPCSGAIVVLTFALLNELYLGGLLSVLAMSVGTAITVSALATLTVLGRSGLERFGKRTRFASLLARCLEIGGALLLTLLGIGLVGGALSG